MEMERYQLIYWKKGLKTHEVKVRKFQTIDELNNYVVGLEDQIEFLVCEFVNQKDGEAKYRLLKRGFYVTLTVIAYVVSITVLAAVIIGVLYLRHRYLSS